MAWWGGRSSESEDSRVIECSVVDDNIGQPGWVDFGHVEAFGGQVPVTVQSFGFGALPVLIPRGTSLNRDLRVHLKPDPQVPVLVDLRAECEDAIDDEYRIGWGLHEDR